MTGWCESDCEGGWNKQVLMPQLIVGVSHCSRAHVNGCVHKAKKDVKLGREERPE